MFKSINHIVLRGLATALSAIVIITSLSSSALAATSNELRKSLGISPNSYGESSVSDTVTSNSGGSIGNSYLNSNNGDSSDDSYAESIVNQSNLNEKISKCEKDIKQLEDNLSTRLANGSTAYIITLTVDDILGKQDELSKLKSTGDIAFDNEYVTQTDNSDIVDPDGITYNYDGVLANSFEPAELAKITSLDYDIGYIGKQAPCIVKNYFKLVTPWGFNKQAYETEYDSKFLGIELYARPDDEIISQWNGVVVDIGTDDTNYLQYIKIYHGNSTYTVYSHVYPISGVYIGTKVKCGQTIAVAGDTSQYEPEKDNHVMYQIRLDGDYINPLLIYGSRGKQIYETWITSHAIDNVVEAGEKYYNDEDETVEPSSQNNPPPLKYDTIN